MNKRVLAILLIAVLALGLFAGCKKYPVSKDEAIDIAMKHLNITRDQVTSKIKVENAPLSTVHCYAVTFIYNNTNFYYKINAETGFIISVAEQPMITIK